MRGEKIQYGDSYFLRTILWLNIIEDHHSCLAVRAGWRDAIMSRRTQSSRRASVPVSTFVSTEKRASSGRVPGKYHRASTGGNDFSLPRIPQPNAGASKFWSIDEDSTQPGAELPRAAPRRKKKDRNTSARSNASNASDVSSASAASRARLAKPKAWGEVS